MAQLVNHTRILLVFNPTSLYFFYPSHSLTISILCSDWGLVLAPIIKGDHEIFILLCLVYFTSHDLFQFHQFFFPKMPGFFLLIHFYDSVIPLDCYLLSLFSFFVQTFLNWCKPICQLFLCWLCLPGSNFMKIFSLSFLSVFFSFWFIFIF